MLFFHYLPIKMVWSSNDMANFMTHFQTLLFQSYNVWTPRQFFILKERDKYVIQTSKFRFGQCGILPSLPHDHSKQYVTYQKRVRKYIITKLEVQGPCTGHRSIIAILHCFPLHERYAIECRLNTLPHKYTWKEVSGND